MEIFWSTISQYNSATWIYQLIIILLGGGLTLLLLLRPQRWVKIAMKVFLILVYLWISIIYYHIYCAARSYNIIRSIYWCFLAAAWIWDLARGYTQFEFNRKYAGLAVLLLIMPFLYPLLSWLRGLSFPEITSPVMPCSVVVFTFGLLLLMSRKVNLFIILLLSHWAMIGLSKTYFFNIPEDFLLVATTIPALYLFFKDYYLRHLTDDATKPRRKYVNLLLMTLSIGIAVILIICLVMELTTDVPTHHPVVINTSTPLAIP